MVKLGHYIGFVLATKMRLAFVCVCESACVCVWLWAALGAVTIKRLPLANNLRI